MKAGWAIAAGIVLGVGAAWWVAQDSTGPERTQTDSAAQSENLLPGLYRWRDQAGVLQVTDQPPPNGHTFDRIDLQPRDGIDIDGARGSDRQAMP